MKEKKWALTLQTDHRWRFHTAAFLLSDCSRDAGGQSARQGALVKATTEAKEGGGGGLIDALGGGGAAQEQREGHDAQVGSIRSLINGQVGGGNSESSCSYNDENIFSVHSNVGR